MAKPIREYWRVDFPSVEARGRVIVQLSAYMTEAITAWTTDPLRAVMLVSAPVDRPAALFLTEGAVRAAESGIALPLSTIVSVKDLPVAVGVIFGDSCDVGSWRFDDTL